MIYFIECQTTKLIKIGFSKMPQARLRDLQVGSPTILKLLYVIAGNKLFEKTLHNQFSKFNHHGEWFENSLEIKSFIDSFIVTNSREQFPAKYLYKKPKKYDSLKQKYENMDFSKNSIIKQLMKSS